MAIKVTIIGAGSLIFSRRLMHDILAVPELRGTTFALSDIAERNLDMVTNLIRREIKANRYPIKPDSGIGTVDKHFIVQFGLEPGCSLSEDGADGDAMPGTRQP